MPQIDPLVFGGLKVVVKDEDKGMPRRLKLPKRIILDLLSQGRAVWFLDGTTPVQLDNITNEGRVVG